MGWTRKMSRVARDRRRPCLESLETRQLLSTTKAHVAASTGSGSGNINGDGSTNFDQVIGASATRSTYGVDGTGQTVAVIDTGVDYKNPALGGAIGPGDKVVTGVDFTNSAGGILPTWQHGTGVAGLIAGSGSKMTGVAPGADIVALRVFGDNNQGSFQQIAQALDWVVQNHNLYNITAVNLSVSDGGNYLSNQFAGDGGVGQEITSAVAKLDTFNIPVVVAAGNSFNGKDQGTGFPSIITDAISVTATDAADKLASDAQRLGSAQGGPSATKIAAPGVNITAPSGDSGTTSESGTSFAAPQVTGGIVLLQQMYEKAYHTLPTIAQLDSLLQQGAVTIHDGVTGVDLGRLNILHSAQILNQQISAVAGTSGANGTSGATSSGSGGGASTSTGTGSTSSGTGAGTGTGTGSTGSVSSVPMTEVIVNGVSMGSYPTSQLRSLYPSLFTFLKGPVSSLRVWAPQGSKLNLGPSKPSAVVAAAFSANGHAMKTARIESKPQARTIGKVTAAVHHPAAHKAPKSFLSYLFPFKL